MYLERHTRSKAVITGLVIGCLLMAVVPSLAQGDLGQGYTSRPLALPDLPREDHLFKDNSIREQEQNSEIPPPRVGEELLGGAVGAVAGGVLGGLIGIGIGNELGPGQERALAGAFIGFGIGYTLGCAIGVYSVGDTENETGNFLATLGGGVAGAFLGGLIGGLGAIPGIPIGATAGFNMTRRYKTPPPSKNGLINIKDGQMRLAIPRVYLQSDPLDRKVLTHNVELVKATF